LSISGAGSDAKYSAANALTAWSLRGVVGLTDSTAGFTDRYGCDEEVTYFANQSWAKTSLDNITYSVKVID